MKRLRSSAPARGEPRSPAISRRGRPSAPKSRLWARDRGLVARLAARARERALSAGGGVAADGCGHVRARRRRSRRDLFLAAVPVGALDALMTQRACRRRTRAVRLARQGIRGRSGAARGRRPRPSSARRRAGRHRSASSRGRASRRRWRTGCRRRWPSRQPPPALAARRRGAAARRTRCAPTSPTTSPASRSAARSRTCSPSPPGASDGLGFGHNARAALITRGTRRDRPAVGRARAARAKR